MATKLTAEEKAARNWGGKRAGAGAKPLTDEQRLERRLKKLEMEAQENGDPVAAMAALIGVSPRVAALRPDLAEKFELVSPGEHIARFARTHCRYHQLGDVLPGGPSIGDAYELEPFELEVYDEAMKCDESGRRIYNTTGLVIPRKNRKTTSGSVLSLYFGSPADGEHRPDVIQAAGVKDQAGKLYNTTRAFIDDPLYASPRLQRLFVPSVHWIACPSVGGHIMRVAGDGDNNHSLDPHVVFCDELHTWKTPKQRENWKALTTAGGGRRDPFVFFMSTEGDGDDNELAALLERIENAPDTDVEHRRPGLTIYRNVPAGLMAFRYAISAHATLEDLDEFERANPAPWRSAERLKRDLIDPKVDAPTKFRLYGNRRGAGADRWIGDDAWEACADLEPIPEGATVTIGVDGARTRDTTAVAWVYENPKGQLVVRTHVWATRPEVAYHSLVTGRMNNDAARDFIRQKLMVEYEVRAVFYDERYFDDQAEELGEEDELVIVEMHQGSPPMQEAWDDFYHRIHQGKVPGILHDRDSVLRAHVRAAAGVKTERGWKVSKIKSERPIDALAASVMGCWGATNPLEDTIEPMGVFA